MKVRSIRMRSKDENEIVCPRQKELPDFGLVDDKMGGMKMVIGAKER